MGRAHIEAFMENVEKIPFSGCWIWMAGMNQNGYGAFYVDGKQVATHRFSYTNFVSPIGKGMFIRHRCDVRCCVNPHHLIEGTQAQNIEDMVSRGRHCVGEKNGISKLTEKQVEEIRSRYVPYSHTANLDLLAKEFGVSLATVHDAVTGRSWRRK